MAFLGMDNLRAAQMGSALAAASTAFSPNPASASGRLSATLQDSAQGSVTAIAAEKAAKRAKKKKSGIGSLVGTAGAIVAAPFTSGASLTYLPAAAAAGGAVDSAMTGDYGAAAGQIGQAAAGAYGGYKSAQGGSMADSVADAGATTPTVPLDASSSLQLGEKMRNITSPPPLVPSGSLDTAGYGNNAMTKKLSSVIPFSPGRRDRLDNNPAAMLGPSVMDAPSPEDTRGKNFRPGIGPHAGVQSPHGHRFTQSPQDIRRMSPDEQERFALQAKQAGVELSPKQLAALKRPVRQQLKAAGTIPENAPSRWGLAMQGMFGAVEAMNQYGNNRYF